MNILGNSFFFPNESFSENNFFSRDLSIIKTSTTIWIKKKKPRINGPYVRLKLTLYYAFNANISKCPCDTHKKKKQNMVYEFLKNDESTTSVGFFDRYVR